MLYPDTSTNRLAGKTVADSPIRLVLADDKPLPDAGIERTLRVAGGFEILARCTTAAKAFHAAQLECAEILTFNLCAVEALGPAIVRNLPEAGHPLKVVVLAAREQEPEALRVISLGIRGLVPRELAHELLVPCLRAVHAGYTCFATRAPELLLAQSHPGWSGDLVAILTRRELDIIALVADGLSNKGIARRLSITEGTVKVHLHRIFQKSGISGRLRLAILLGK